MFTFSQHLWNIQIWNKQLTEGKGEETDEDQYFGHVQPPEGKMIFLFKKIGIKHWKVFTTIAQ